MVLRSGPQIRRTKHPQQIPVAGCGRAASAPGRLHQLRDQRPRRSVHGPFFRGANLHRRRNGRQVVRPLSTARSAAGSRDLARGYQGWMKLTGEVVTARHLQIAAARSSRASRDTQSAQTRSASDQTSRRALLDSRWPQLRHVGLNGQERCRCTVACNGSPSAIIENRRQTSRRNGRVRSREGVVAGSLWNRRSVILPLPRCVRFCREAWPWARAG